MSEMTSQFKKSVKADAPEYEDRIYLIITFPFFSISMSSFTYVKNHSEAVTLDTNEDASLENRYLDEMGGGGV